MDEIEADIAKDARQASTSGKLDDLREYVSPKNPSSRQVDQGQGVFVDEYGGIKPTRSPSRSAWSWRSSASRSCATSPSSRLTEPARTTVSHPDTTPNADGSVPIKLLHDRLLVHVDDSDGDRHPAAASLIPRPRRSAKAPCGRAPSPSVERAHHPVGDQALFDPEDHPEVELPQAYVLLRERDVHGPSRPGRRPGS